MPTKTKEGFSPINTAKSVTDLSQIRQFAPEKVLTTEAKFVWFESVKMDLTKEGPL